MFVNVDDEATIEKKTHTHIHISSQHVTQHKMAAKRCVRHRRLLRLGSRQHLSRLGSGLVVCTHLHTMRFARLHANWFYKPNSCVWSSSADRFGPSIPAAKTNHLQANWRDSPGERSPLACCFESDCGAAEKIVADIRLCLLDRWRRTRDRGWSTCT
jgi:hypothetical protein